MKSVCSLSTICSLAFVAGFGVAACSSDSSNPAGVDGGGTPGTDGGGTAMGQDGGGADGPAAEVDCSKAADGTLCATDGVCVAGVCATSRCGDTYIDSRTGEECEDKNDNTGDGCTQCRFDCKSSATCDDGNACNGAESCSEAAHVCEPGVIAGAISCTTAAGMQGMCKAGSCGRPGCGNGTIEVGEDCDDSTAGCTKDCKFTCIADADCDNKNACDGGETCTVLTHSCKAGTAVVCNANGCAGMCDPGAGTCAYADADKDGSRCDLDCNDVDPATFPGGFECKDGKDNDCNVATADGAAPGCECYIDSDKDGFASSVTGAIASPGTCQAGFTRTKPIDAATTDCGPGNTSAFPGQTLYFPTAYCVSSRFCLVGQGSFDYNCNKTEESTLTDNKVAAASCAGAANSFACLFASGWVGAIPACGKPGTYRTCSYGKIGCTGIDSKERPRPCR